MYATKHKKAMPFSYCCLGLTQASLTKRLLVLGNNTTLNCKPTRSKIWRLSHTVSNRVAIIGTVHDPPAAVLHAAVHVHRQEHHCGMLATCLIGVGETRGNKRTLLKLV